MNAKRVGRLAFAACGLFALPAGAVTYDLTAEAYVKTMADGRQVTMWGYFLAGGGGPASPGPLLTVPAGDTVLTINLTNNLAVPTSIMLPGQPTGGAPVWVDEAGTVVGTGTRPAGDYAARVRSFAPETAPGATASYSFTVRPGTYLYESATHPAMQVQMGLYGAAAVEAAGGAAYPGVTVDNQAVVLFSEVDAEFHDAVTNGTYGTAAYPTALDYRPAYFLVNGEAAPAAAPILAAPLTVNQRVLLRVLNAGLQSRNAALGTGGYLRVVAEDGYLKGHAELRTVLPLPAGKTLDAVFEPRRPGAYALFDRGMGQTSGALHGAGALARLEVADAVGRPVAVGDAYAFAEDGVFATNAANGVLSNDGGGAGPLTATLLSGTSHGTLALAADGTFTYTPAANFNGTDSFVYRAGDGVAFSDPAVATLTVTPVNDLPVAGNTTFTTFQNTPIAVSVPGALGTSTDADGNPLTAVLTGALTPATLGALTLNADGSLLFTPGLNRTGAGTFRYRANDGTGNSVNEGIGTINVLARANQAPTAFDDSVTTRKNTAIVIPVLANDRDVDGTLVLNSVRIVTPPLRGVAVANANGTITYTPQNNFVGSVAFTYSVRDNRGATSNAAKVRVTITK